MGSLSLSIHDQGRRNSEPYVGLLNSNHSVKNGPKFKLITEGYINVCRINHSRNIINKILSSNLLRRWESHYIILSNSEIYSTTNVGFMENTIPYSLIEDIHVMSRWDLNQRFCLQINIHDACILFQVNNLHLRDQWLYSLQWKKQVLKYTKLLQNTTRPEVLIREIKHIIDLAMNIPLQDEEIYQIPLELISDLLQKNKYIPKNIHENIITALAPLLENNHPSPEICDFFTKHCKDNPRSTVVLEMFTSVVQRILKHNMCCNLQDFGKYPKMRIFVQEYIQALNSQNNGVELVEKLVKNMHGPASICPHPGLLPNLVSVILSGIYSCYDEKLKLKEDALNDETFYDTVMDDTKHPKYNNNNIENINVINGNINNNNNNNINLSDNHINHLNLTNNGDNDMFINQNYQQSHMESDMDSSEYCSRKKQSFNQHITLRELESRLRIKMDEIDRRLICYLAMIQVMSAYEDWRPLLSSLLQPIPFPDYALCHTLFMRRMERVVLNIAKDPRCEVHQTLLGVREGKEGWLHLYCPANSIYCCYNDYGTTPNTNGNNGFGTNNTTSNFLVTSDNFIMCGDQNGDENFASQERKLQNGKIIDHHKIHRTKQFIMPHPGDDNNEENTQSHTNGLLLQNGEPLIITTNDNTSYNDQTAKTDCSDDIKDCYGESQIHFTKEGFISGKKIYNNSSHIDNEMSEFLNLDLTKLENGTNGINSSTSSVSQCCSISDETSSLTNSINSNDPFNKKSFDKKMHNYEKTNLKVPNGGICRPNNNSNTLKFIDEKVDDPITCGPNNHHTDIINSSYMDCIDSETNQPNICHQPIITQNGINTDRELNTNIENHDVNTDDSTYIQYEGQLFCEMLTTLMHCCCKRKKFLMHMKKMLGPCMLLALREHEIAMEVLCAMLEMDTIENMDLKLQCVTTLQSTSKGKALYTSLCDRLAALKELQQKGGPKRLTLPAGSTDSDLSKILSQGSFGNLECLSLAFTHVTSACAEMLIKLPALKYLNLWSTQFGDTGLTLIAEHLTNLRVLNLCETPVTDKGLATLSALKNLRKLNLNSTSLSAKTFENLKEKLPALQECDIRYTDAW